MNKKQPDDLMSNKFLLLLLFFGAMDVIGWKYLPLPWPFDVHYFVFVVLLLAIKLLLYQTREILIFVVPVERLKRVSTINSGLGLDGLMTKNEPLLNVLQISTSTKKVIWTGKTKKSYIFIFYIKKRSSSFQNCL
jgi:hypothetical protein